MSSLMQFRGDIKNGKVGLQFQLVRSSVPGDNALYSMVDADPYRCKQCNCDHARIAVAYRRPAGMLGCWVIFRYLGKKNVPDLSIPISVEKYPLGACILSDEESSKIWHDMA